MLKRLLCALLAALMVSCTFVACTDNDGKDSNESKKEESTKPEGNGESLDIPDTKYDDNNKGICFLTRDEAEWSTVEIFAERPTSASDNISQAVYERNDSIKEKYGVVIKEYPRSTDQHVTDVGKEIQSKSGDFQAVISNCRMSASMASQNMLWDLNSSDVEYIDFSKSWWDQNMATCMSIDKKLFFATGDLLTSDNDATFMILFNRKLATNHQIPDLYKIVENGEWTLDKMYEFAQQGVEPGTDGTIAYDNGVAGFAYTDSAPSSFMFASNVTLVQKNDEDVPVYEFNLDHAQNVSEKVKLLFSNQHAVQLPGGNLYESGKTCFGENHALFYSECMQTVTRMREYDIDFGILPAPKYDTHQNYASMMHHTASMVSIPVSIVDDDLTMTACMIEAMACYSQDTLTVEYYDKNLKTKGAKDEQSGPMIDKILANRICDLSYYYQWGGSAYENIAATLLPTSNKQLSSESNRHKKKITTDINKFLDAMN